VAGDIGERPAQLDFALRHLTSRFRRVVWVPGNHDLWSHGRHVDAPEGTGLHGQALYEELISLCRSHDVLTPEDPYVEWPPEPDTFIVPMFLLYDYTFRPPHVSASEAVAWARESGVGCADEQFLDPSPWPTRSAWCHARCAATAARLEALPEAARTILINHWPLRYDLARPPRIPRFSIWSGTTITENWGRRFRARAVVSGHLHMRTTLFRDGVRCEEVSFGYPRDWSSDRGIDWYLRQILPDLPEVSPRFVPRRDPFVSGAL
jgi:hypothetical protein